MVMTTRQTSKLTKEQVGYKYGFRSGLEETVAEWLTARKIKFGYEDQVIKYEKPAKIARYTPDFSLANGIIVETKGRFLTADRQKHLLIQKQHPELDIRFVFSNSKARISKQSKTTYADWCEKYGFIYADKQIPMEWIND